VQQQVVVTQPPPPQPVDQALIQAMQAQMRTMLAQPIRPAEVTHFVRPGMQQGGAFGQTGGGMQEAQALAAAMREQATRSGGGMATPANPSGQVMPGQQVMATQARIPSRFSPPAAGTILYGQLVGRVNSDVPGPVIGEILQGPLAGARLLGSFQFSEQGVIIQFTSMTVPFRDADGLERTEVVPIRAFAVDAANLSTAMATSIDRRVFERVAFGFATAFLQGLGQAIASSGATTNVLPGGGVSVTTPQLNTTQQLTIAGGAAMANTARILDQTYGRRRTTIIVEAGTPFGVLFMDSQSN
jgi:intracellular multiplication protein IcmE